ncbi:hypothetical protein PIB30_005357 [Stylosanthes scabra]|uniref:Uncharacterized protein n=1 Tax=Stylosanthes scabra TaxID=79078 RepID=A0ABU6W218_9FABA|nr:hypothetical protein [Stylosanthes scabra]
MNGCYVSHETTLCQEVEWVELTPSPRPYADFLAKKRGWRRLPPQAKADADAPSSPCAGAVNADFVLKPWLARTRPLRKGIGSSRVGLSHDGDMMDDLDEIIFGKRGVGDDSTNPRRSSTPQMHSLSNTSVTSYFYNFLDHGFEPVLQLRPQ